MLHMHRALVERVWNSGLVDARSLINATLFERILVMRSAGNDSDPEIGDQCLVLSDGRQHFVMGILPRTDVDPDGNPTTRNSINDLIRAKDAVSIVSSDNFGNSARITTSRSSGSMVDGGEYCATHWDPGRREINDYSERYARYTVPCIERIDHQNSSCTVLKVIRTTVDPASVVRDLELKTKSELMPGSVFEELFSGDTCSFRSLSSGITTFSQEIDASNGSFDTYAKGNINQTSESDTFVGSEGKISITSYSDNIEIVAGTLPSQLTLKITSLGKISISHTSGVELLGLIDQLLTAASTTVVPTAIGPQRPEPLATIAATLLPLLQVIKE